MNKIVGIDLGTTNSLVATVDSGIPLVIADSEGRRLTPSVVHLPHPGAEPIIGHAAARMRAVKPAETVYSVKRFMGRRGEDLKQEEMVVTYPVVGKDAGPVTIPMRSPIRMPSNLPLNVSLITLFAGAGIISPYQAATSSSRRRFLMKFWPRRKNRGASRRSAHSNIAAAPSECCNGGEARLRRIL